MSQQIRVKLNSIRQDYDAYRVSCQMYIYRLIKVYLLREKESMLKNIYIFTVMGIFGYFQSDIGDP